MNDEIRPPTPTHSPRSSSRDDVRPEQGRASETTTTVISQEGKLGILINRQFAPLTITLNAKVGDLVRVRIEQVGKENSVRVLRIIEPTQAAGFPTPVTPRTLRDLFPATNIRPLQELLISLQEVLDLSPIGEEAEQTQIAIPSQGQVPDPAKSGGIMSDVPPTARPNQIPAAYGARNAELRASDSTAASQPPPLPPDALPRLTRTTATQSVISALSATLFPTNSWSTPISSTRDALNTFVEEALRRLLPLSSHLQPEPERAEFDSPQDKYPLKKQEVTKVRSKMIPGGDGSETLSLTALQSDLSYLGSASKPALRFHRSATEAQPILDQFNRLFESLQQPSYLLTSLVIGSHIIPFELSLFKEPPPADRTDSEERRTPARQGFSRVRLTIHLPTLGSVGIDIAHRESEVLLKFTSASSMVTQFLSDEIPFFSKELQHRGYRLISWLTENTPPASIAPGWFQDLVTGGIVA